MLMDRSVLAADAVEVAPRLLGAVLQVTTGDGVVALRITEVEAYHGLGTGDVPDLASHARMGPTARNRTMWGEPGHLYVYMNYGMHDAVNIACSPDGRASGALLRAGEVVRGIELARARRPAARKDTELAQGPGRLARALGLVSRLHDGVDALGGTQDGVLVELFTPVPPLAEILRGPRTGVVGDALACALHWRFWLAGDPTVSRYRPGRIAANRRGAVAG